MSVENAGKVTLTIRIAVPRLLEKQPLRGAHESRGSTNGIFLGRKIAAHNPGEKKSAVSASYLNLLCKSNRNSELKGTWRNKIPVGLDDDHASGLTNDRQLFMWIRGERGDRGRSAADGRFLHKSRPLTIFQIFALPSFFMRARRAKSAFTRCKILKNRTREREWDFGNRISDICTPSFFSKRRPRPLQNKLERV